MGGYCDESKKRYQYSLCPVGHDCCRNCGLDHSDCPHTAHDGRLYQPSIPDWCFQRNRTHTMYYPQLYAKIAEETQLRLFFILWRAVNRKSLFTLTLILNFPFRLAKSRLRRLFAGRPLRWVSPFSIIISTLEKGVGQIRLLFLHCEGKSAALSLEGLTVGALIHRWISLVRANGNAVQRTVRSGRTMVCALLHRAVDRLVAAIVTHRE